VRVIRHIKNRGFNQAVRTAAASAKQGIFYMLNSDVSVEPEAFQALVSHFENPDIFAVASLDVERMPSCVPAFTDHSGLLGIGYLAIQPPLEAVSIAFATGGHAAYHAGRFRQLGGFDTLFDPIYWEDVDICTRARARGWRVLLEPKSRVRHSPGGTMSRRRPSSVIEGYRAAHRWLYTLRHSQHLGPLSVLMLAATHPKSWPAALMKGCRRALAIHRCARSSAAALASERMPVVKHRHKQPWTVAFFSATGDIVGGGELSLLTLLGSLDRTRLRPVLVCPSEGELTRRARQMGIDVHCIKVSPSLRGVFDGTVPRLARWMRDQGVDLVHANSAGRLVLLPGLAARLLGIPVVWHVRISSGEPFQDRLQAAVCSQLIATSNFVASRFNPALRRKKLCVIANSVDLEQFRPGLPDAQLRASLGIPSDRLCVGVFGRMDSWKRFDLAIRAVALARKMDDRIHLVLAGDGPERGSLERLAQELGLGSTVSFIGWQADAAIAMQAVDIVLHPTPGEHFGRVFIEAMAAGKPLIAAASGAAPELIQDGQTGLLVPANDAGAIADALVRLSRDAQLRFEMGLRARRHAEERFSAEKSAQSVQAVYEQLLLGKDGPVQ
jgi:glycosyltransferase involved in cell wall biosynthesis